MVTFVAGPSTRRSRRSAPSWSRRRPAAADAAGSELVDDVRDDLGVTVNPRYGVLEEGELVAGDGGVVDILEEGGAEPPADAGPPGD